MFRLFRAIDLQLLLVGSYQRQVLLNSVCNVLLELHSDHYNLHFLGKFQPDLRVQHFLHHCNASTFHLLVVQNLAKQLLQ